MSCLFIAIGCKKALVEPAELGIGLSMCLGAHLDPPQDSCYFFPSQHTFREKCDHYFLITV